MSEIIKLWIQEKLGIIIKLTPDNFCELTRDGYLLCRILRSYEIINEDQLNMIEKSNLRQICLKNFEEHISTWLKMINISLLPEEIIDIIDNHGLSSLSLFYRVFLELHEKDCITFIAKNRLSGKLRPQSSKFIVEPVKETTYDKLDDSRYKDHLENSHDVVHWLQDRLEMVITRCKIARQEYLSVMRNSDKRISNSFSIPSLYGDEDFPDEIENVSIVSENEPYEVLIKKKKEVCKLKEFVPHYYESKQILGNIKAKLKNKAENEVFMKELQKHIMQDFWNNIVSEENQDFNAGIAQKMLKQSVYEKQMQQKLRDVKYQKETMLQGKKILWSRISKQKENEFLEKVMERSEQFNKEEFQYYLEKERALQLHKAIYKEKLRLKAERTFKLCEDAIKGISYMAVKLAEYKDFFGEEPSQRIVDNWRKLVCSPYSLEDTKVPVEKIISPGSAPMEHIVRSEIEKETEMDKKDLESYVRFEWPWILKDVPDEQIKEMNNGINILGHIVNQLLNVKYPLPSLPTPPNLPQVDIRVCLNGLPDLSCLQLLQKLLNHKGVLVVELQDCINFCINAYKQESKDEKAEAADEEEIYDDVIEPEIRKGQKSKTGTIRVDGNELEIKLSDKCIQTPTYYPDEQIKFSQPATLGKIAFEEISKGNFLTDFILVSMFIEYVKVHQENIKGWVLINYPTNFEQAILFEEAISGLEVPGVSDMEKIFKSLTDIVYMCEPKKEHSGDDRRYSRLLSVLNAKIEKPSYDTVLTAFISIYSETEESNESDIPNEPNDTEDTNKLQTFYTDQGCNYSVYYQNFDFFTVKHIAKLIIGDYSIPRKSSVELFGDTIRYITPEGGENGKNVSSVKQGEKKEEERIERVIKGRDSATDNEEQPAGPSTAKGRRL